MIIDLEKAISLILSDDIAALPTETVYGLAGNANSNIACEKIYNAKRRPLFNPLIIHVLNLEEAKKYGEFNEDALKIASNFWPGPITIILPKIQSEISPVATANLETIAIRVPSHPVFREVLEKTQLPLAAPSANLSTHISPTTAEHVNKSFLGKIPVIDGGRTIYGIESTIIDCTQDNPVILRHGFISEEVISNELGKILAASSQDEKIKAPGMLKKHYSPNCPIRINATSALNNELAINFGSSNLVGAKSFNLSSISDLTEAAANLYFLLQKAEDIVRWEKLSGIAVAPVPNEQIGIAINDKLERACAK